MTFLNPAVLFGLLAASIPVLIHLLNLRKLKKIDFSTLIFLKELQKNKIRKVRLKQWLLLVMRVIIILAIVFAFARPALRGTSIGGTASAAKTTAVFILDDTFSMAAIGSRGSYLNQAKETIKQLVYKMQEGDEAALILVSEGISGQESVTTNLVEFLKRIERVEVSFASGYIHDAVAKSAGIISASKNFNKEIYLLSDFQQNRIAEEGNLSDFSEVFHPGVKLYGFNYSGKEIYNTAVTDFRVQTRIFEKNKPVLFDVTIANYSSSPVNDLVLSLFMNSERSGQKSVDIPSGATVTVNIEANLKRTGYNDFFCEIEDDEILQDNKRFLSIYVPSEIPGIIFYESKDDIRFIDLALKAAGENNPLKINSANISQIPSFNMSSVKFLVLCSGSGNVNGIDKIKTFAENGGGVVLFPSSTSTLQNFNNILAALSLPEAEGIIGKTGEPAASNRFSEIDFGHPLFSDIFVKDKKRIESPDIFYNYKIIPSGKGRNIISLLDGSSFLSEYSKGKGRIIVYSSLPYPGWNNLPLKGIFPLLIYKTVLYLSEPQKEFEDLYAGGLAIINLSGRSVPHVKIADPDGSSSAVNTSGENFVNYRRTAEAGIYTVSSNDDVIGKFQVNTDPAESIMKYMPADEFNEYLESISFKGDYVNIDPGGDPSGEILQARFGSELWKIFAVIALMFALVEMTVARSMKKDLTEINRSS